jgi:hypothetical protein
MARVITCEPRPDCEVEIIGSGRLSPGEAALLIAEIARAAKQAHSYSGQPLPAAGTQVEAAIAFAEISAVGLLPEESLKNHCLLTLHFGATVIGISIPNADARRLGQTLIVASADDPAPH